LTADPLYQPKIAVKAPEPETPPPVTPTGPVMLVCV